MTIQLSELFTYTEDKNNARFTKVTSIEHYKQSVSKLLKMYPSMYSDSNWDEHKKDLRFDKQLCLFIFIDNFDEHVGRYGICNDTLISVDTAVRIKFPTSDKHRLLGVISRL